MNLLPFVLSVDRAGAQKKAIGRGERPLSLEHRRTIFFIVTLGTLIDVQ